jgi:hypothetical protein
MSNYTPSNWYWSVAGSPTQVYSSERAEYVSVTDSAYSSWLAAENLPTRIDTDADLQVVLYQAGVLGLNVTSTSTPAVNGVYSTTPQSKLDIEGTIDDILLNGTFPGGLTAMPWTDMSGAEHVFPSVAVFKEFATAYANFIDAVEDYINSAGTIGAIPSTSVTIP